MIIYNTHNITDVRVNLRGEHLLTSTLSRIGGLVLLVLTGAAGSLQADDSQDSALYDLAPENSAFVRLINLRKSASKVSLANQNLQSNDYCSASRYRYFSPGEYQVLSQDLQLTAQLEPQQAYSIVIDTDRITLMKDAYVTDRKLSLVSAYNFSKTTSLALKTADGKHTVFSNLQPLQPQARTINPVKARFSVFADSVSVLLLQPVIFERGVASSLLICGEDTPVLSRWVRQ